MSELVSLAAVAEGGASVVLLVAFLYVVLRCRISIDCGEKDEKTLTSEKE